MSGLLGTVGDFCRLCLNENEVLPIFNEDDNQADNVSQKIFECVAIEVAKDNVLPTVICADCLGNVNSWYLFKQKCHQTQTTLMSMYEKGLTRKSDSVNKDYLTNKLNGVRDPSRTFYNKNIAGDIPVVCISDDSEEEEEEEEEEGEECDDNEVTCFSPSPASIINLDDDDEQTVEMSVDKNGEAASSNRSDFDDVSQSKSIPDSEVDLNKPNENDENRETTEIMEVETNKQNDTEETNFSGNSGKGGNESSQNGLSSEDCTTTITAGTVERDDKTESSSTPTETFSGPNIDDIVSDILLLNKTQSICDGENENSQSTAVKENTADSQNNIEIGDKTDEKEPSERTEAINESTVNDDKQCESEHKTNSESNDENKMDVDSNEQVCDNKMDTSSTDQGKEISSTLEGNLETKISGEPLDPVENQSNSVNDITDSCNNSSNKNSKADKTDSSPCAENEGQIADTTSTTNVNSNPNTGVASSEAQKTQNKNNLQSFSAIRIESTVTLPFDEFDQQNKPTEGPASKQNPKDTTQNSSATSEETTANKEQPQEVPTNNSGTDSGDKVESNEHEQQPKENSAPASTPNQGQSNTEEGQDVETVDEQLPERTVVAHVVEGNETDLPVPVTSIKQEPIDTGYSENFRAVQIKREPIFSDDADDFASYEQGEDGGPYEVNDPTLDVRTNSCLICKYKYATLPNLIRHVKTKLHQSLLAAGIKREGKPVDAPELSSSLLKQALVKKKTRRRKGGPFSRTKKYICRLCRVVFRSSSSLGRHGHSLKHRNALNAQMNRPLELSNRQAKANVIHNNYSEDKDYICPMPNCNYTCKEGSTLLSHMTYHGINRNKRAQIPKPSPPVYKKEYRCEYHDVVFYDGRGFQNHIRVCKHAQAQQASQQQQEQHQQQYQQQQIESGHSTKALYCKTCNLKFATKEIHLNHIRIYHKGSSAEQDLKSNRTYLQRNPTSLKNRRQNAYCCKYCGKRFNFMYSLNYHLKTHQQNSASTSSSSITCKLCKKTFKTYKVYRVHIKSHFLPPGSRKLFCSKCYKSFDTRSELGLHRSRGLCKSIKMKIYTCSDCNHSFKEISALNEHKATEHCGNEAQGVQITDGKDTFCRLCQKNFCNFANLKRHCIQVHRMTQIAFRSFLVQYPAEIKQDYSETNVTEEQQFDEEQEQEPEQEQEEEQQTGSVDMNNTIEEQPTEYVNVEKGEFPCNYCGKSFKLQRILTLHLNNFCTNSPNRPKCGQCGTYVTKKGCKGCIEQQQYQEQAVLDQQPAMLLEQTMDAVPGGSSEHQLFSCPIGKMTFTNEKSMLRHYSYCNGECANVITCSNCRKGFRSVKALDTHICIKNKKPYRYNCVKCMRSFSRKSYLVNHESKCIGYSLEEQQPLDTSLLMDTKPVNHFNEIIDQKPIIEDRTKGFPCNLCPKVFSTQKGMSGHQWVHKNTRKQQPKDLHECRFCGKDNILLNQLYSHSYKCIKGMLNTEEILSCEDCEGIFSREDPGKELAAKVQNHIIMCYPIPYYKYEDQGEHSPKLLCCYCCYAFSSVESLTAHKAEHIRNKRARAATHSTRPRKRVRANTGQALGVHFLDDFIAPDQEMTVGEEMGFVGDYQEMQIDSKELRCKVCNRQFANVTKRRNHEKVHGIVRKNVYDEEANMTI